MKAAMGLIITVLVAIFLMGAISVTALVLIIGVSSAWMLLVGALMGDGEEGRRES